MVKSYIVLFLFWLSFQARAMAPQCANIFTNDYRATSILVSKTEVNKKVYDLIDSAKNSLDISISSIPNEHLVGVLLSKAQHGVRVRLILDGRHFHKNSDIIRFFNKQVRTLQHPNIDIRITSPLSLAANRKYHGAVLHRKIVIVDDKDVYVGSSNLSDQQGNLEIGYFTSSHAAEIRQVFASDFRNVQNRSFETISKKVDAKSEGPWVGPNTNRPDIQKEILNLITGAKNKLWINAFEFTDSRTLEAILNAKKSNPELDIRVLLNDEQSNFWFDGKKFLHRSNEETFNLLIKNSIPVRVYKDGGALLHARFIVTENTILAGSFDLTRRSYEGNIDLGFYTKDNESVTYTADQYLTLWEQAEPPAPSTFNWENKLSNFYENKVLPRLKVQAAEPTPLKLTYGWEVEFQTSESPRILTYYKLKSFSDKDWEALSLEERRQKLNESLRKTPKLIRAALSYFGMAYLVRLKSAPAELPPKALLESHGTVELVGDVENNLTDLNTKTREIENLIGRGYWQSHIVFPQIHTENISGWISFSSDQAFIGHLEASYKSYLKDSKNIPGSVLTHYALGPLDAKTFMNIKKRETKATKGQSIGSGGTDRLIYGPALRDDAYPEGLVGVELRQFSKRREDLLREADALSDLLHKNQLFIFNGFKETKMLDYTLIESLSQTDRAAWKKLMQELDTTIQKSSPNIAIGGAPYGLRFLTPLRDWEHHPVLILSKLDPEKVSAVRNRLSQARQEFIQDVNTVISNSSNPKEKVDQMKVAVAKWASQAQLSELFNNWRAH